ncbi:MAG: EamA family transporter [Acidobacteriota bacterium]|jgi:drug/metabolite transporter (DMT)-like permease
MTDPGSTLKRSAPAALVFITAIWGFTFVVVRDAVAVYPVFLFLALRFSLGAAVVLAIFPRSALKLSRRDLLGAAVMGAALFSGYALQTEGLRFTTAARSGFITGLYVIFTPLLETSLVRRLPHRLVLLGACCAAGGLWLLSGTGNSGAMNLGDVLTVGCAFMYAAHILITAHMSRRADVRGLVVVQLAVVALLSWIFAAPNLHLLFPVPRAAIKGILYTAFLATSLAYFVQTAFQRYVSASQAAIIFTMEPVFSGIFAVMIGGESLGWPALCGGAMILSGMFLGQWPDLRRRRA